VAFSVFSKELELLSEVILQTADGLNALGVGGSVVAGADGTWYVAYDADINASPITAAHATRVARYRENGAELQELFAELLPCELGTCPEPSTALVIPSLALDGATGLVGTVHGSQFVGHLTPFGCY
jgi:hypothetical protein